MFTRVKTAAEIESMRTGGKMLAEVLSYLGKKLVVGMSTKQLADVAASELKKLGGEPAFLGYDGFPDVICISVNDEVVHGIPRESKIIDQGDVVGLDFGVVYQGMITDSAISVVAGKGADDDIRLVNATRKALEVGIGVVKNGVRTGDIGAAVQSVLTRGHYGIVRDLVGHGVGHYLHEEPNIPNYGYRNTGSRLLAGMTVAIEPMATLGADSVKIEGDGWTVKTMDGSRSAHFEHTVLITEAGVEVITADS